MLESNLKRYLNAEPVLYSTHAYTLAVMTTASWILAARSKLYENAVNSPQKELLDGVGHGEKRFDCRSYIADWFMKQLQAE